MKKLLLSRALVSSALALALALPAFAQDAPSALDAADVAEPTPAVAEAAAAPSTSPPAPEALEREERKDGDVRVRGASDRVVFVGGRGVEVASTSPDLFAAGETLELGGVVRDNLLGAGRSVLVKGPVGGDAFLFGESLRVTADVEGDLYALGETLTIPAGTTVGGNVYFGGATLELAGTVGGSLLGGGADIDIDGTVHGDVEVEVAHLEVGPDARIGGRLDYTSPEQGSIADQARVGAVDWTQKAVDADTDRHDSGSGVGAKVFFLLSGLLIGAVLLWLFPRALKRPAAVIEEEAPVALGVGFAVLLGVPVLALFLAFFILPIPLSLLAMAIYLPATFLARFIAALALGGLVLTRLGKQGGPFAALAVGLVVLHLLYWIPLLGGLVMLAATVLGLGGLFLASRRAAQAA